MSDAIELEKLGGTYCRACGSTDTEVKDSRPAGDGTYIRRRRACTHCDWRWTTYELDAACFEFVEAHDLWREFLKLTHRQREILRLLFAEFGVTLPAMRVRPETDPLKISAVAPANDEPPATGSPDGQGLQGGDWRALII